MFYAADSQLERTAVMGLETAAVRLEKYAWSDIVALQQSSNGLLVIPTGATEQHGPHLPINCDTIIAQALCWRASALTGTPVLPAIPYTVSVGHTAKWPGTFSLRHETYMAMLREIVAWALATGWSRIIILNSHFGNDATQRVAVDQLRTEFIGRLLISAQNSFQLSPAIYTAFTEDAEDLHANKAETELLLHLTPELVHLDRHADDADRTQGKVFSYPVAQTSLNGVTGFPSRASAEKGKLLFETMADAFAEILQRARVEQPPLDKSYWDSLPKPFRYL